MFYLIPISNLFIVLTAHCLAGQKLASNGFSHRLLGAFWCLSAVVFASAYVGVLVSFLRFPKLTPIINKLEELPESHLKWAVLRGTALESLFTVTKNCRRDDNFSTFFFIGSHKWSLQNDWRFKYYYCKSRLPIPCHEFFFI